MLFWAVIDGDDSVEIEAQTFQFPEVFDGDHFVEFEVAPIGAPFCRPNKVQPFRIVEQGFNDTCRVVHASRRPYAHGVFSEALIDEVHCVWTNLAAIWPRHEISPLCGNRLAPMNQRLIKIKNNCEAITQFGLSLVCWKLDANRWFRVLCRPLTPGSIQ